MVGVTTEAGLRPGGKPTVPNLRGEEASLRHRWLLAAFALVVSLAAAELVLPLVPPHLGTMQRIVHHVDASGNYYLRPNTEVEFGGMFEKLSPAVTWQINDQGLRARAHIGPPSSKMRMATYGDSETFGWSVAIDDSFQRRMEMADPRLEAINFGIPGYNAENVADRIEATVAAYAPDLLVYLVNKNDVDLPNDISDSVLSSDLLLRLRFLWQVVVTKPWRQKLRVSPERLTFLSRQLERIAILSERAGVPLVLVFMKTASWEGAASQAAPGGHVEAARSGFSRAAAVSAPRIVLAEEWLRPFPRLDDHLPAGAHAVLARNLCRVLAGPSAEGCLPPDWNAGGRHAPTPVIAVAEPEGDAETVPVFAAVAAPGR